MIGDNIKRIRMMRNMTQGELADAIHVKRQTVSSWEVNRTEPNMGVIELLADALNCRKSDIIGEQDVAADVHTSGQPNWYTNPETAAIAQRLFESPETRVLFDAAQDSTPENLLLAADLLRRLKGTNRDG